MIYTMKAHPTMYKGTLFRSRLEARYAAYFDLCGFKWEYEPIDLEGWTPDFHVLVPCHHSECCDEHEFWAEVKPYESAEQFEGHACQRFNKNYEFAAVGLGLNPHIETTTQFAHGAGGGLETLSNWVGRYDNPNKSMHWSGKDGWQWHTPDIDALWAEAGSLTRYKKEQYVN